MGSQNLSVSAFLYGVCQVAAAAVVGAAAAEGAEMTPAEAAGQRLPCATWTRCDFFYLSSWNGS